MEEVGHYLNECFSKSKLEQNEKKQKKKNRKTAIYQEILLTYPVLNCIKH